MGPLKWFKRKQTATEYTDVADRITEWLSGDSAAESFYRPVVSYSSSPRGPVTTEVEAQVLKVVRDSAEFMYVDEVAKAMGKSNDWARRHLWSLERKGLLESSLRKRDPHVRGAKSLVFRVA